MTYFRDLDITHFKGAQVIVDIDGTIVEDGGVLVRNPEKEVIRKLHQIGAVYLCSNGNIERTKRVAHDLGVLYIDTHHKKPNKKAGATLPHAHKRVVIGDKVLTDGLFALNLGATFVQVLRTSNSNEDVAVKVINAIDSVLSFFLRPLLPALSFARILRPEQWIKNVLVFAPVFFAGQAFVVSSLKTGVLTFVAFSLVASVVYTFNDIFDYEADRKHPTKRFRALPSGTLATWGITLLGTILGASVALLLLFVPSIAPYLLFYVLANVAYSGYIKHVAVLDIVMVASFYVLRVVVGGVAVGVVVSPWLLLATFFLALFLVSGKRRAEFSLLERRKVLEGYAPETLNYIFVGSALLSIMTYSSWVILTHPSMPAVASVLLAVAGIFRAMNRLFIDPARGDMPEAILFMDRWLFICAITWGLLMLATFYGV